MKKIYVLIAVLFATVQLTQAQYRLAKGDKQFNIAAGGSSYGTAAGFLGTIGLDFGIHRDVSIGGELSIRAMTDALSYAGYYGNVGYNRAYTAFGINANGNYHFNTLLKIPSKWDLYAGVNLGVYIIAYPGYAYYDAYNNYYPSSGSTIVRPGIGLQTGGRYYFAKNIAIQGEVGFNNLFVFGKLGASFAF